MPPLKISVVTPSYNQGSYLEETMTSVLSQGYPNLEYIVIDGGSTDNSVDIIKKHALQLTYWISEKDKGQTDAINKGFRRATGDIIAWLNSDDTYCPDTLRLVAAYFESHPDCQWLAGNVLFMDKDSRTYLRKYPNSTRQLERNAMMSLYQPSLFLRSSILNTIGYPKEEFHMIMDYEWFYRIAQRFPVHILDVDFSCFRLHPDSKSSSAAHSTNITRYKAETRDIIKMYHPKYAKLVDRFPDFSLFIWYRLVKATRLFVRIRKLQFRELRDRL